MKRIYSADEYLGEAEKKARAEFSKAYEIAKRDNIPVIILTPYLEEMPPLLELDSNVEIIHWETFWFNRTIVAWRAHNKNNVSKNLDMSNLRNGESITDFKYPYITLNNISKNHRCHISRINVKECDICHY